MRLLFLFLFLSPSHFAQFYNGSQTDFGKNRVQEKLFNWTYFRYDGFDVYFYEGGKEMARYVSKSAYEKIKDIEKLFDYRIDGRIQFIVYNKQSDFKQSNIGYSSDEQYNTGGVTRIIGTKVMIYFDGDHAKLDRQIRAGVGEILVNQMMYGGNLKEMLKNSTLLTLPDWYVKGLVSYVSNSWDVDIDNFVKDGITNNKYKKFNHLTGQDALYAGHSMWYYISETYGDAVIPNLLYMTKVSRNVESSFLFVLGVSLKNLTKDWLEFFKTRYEENDKTKALPQQAPLVKKKIKTTRVYNQFKISPDGKYAVYVSNELGQCKLWLHDLNTDKRKRILKFGQKMDRINDYSYPLLAWHPSSRLFSIITESKNKIFITQYELDTKSKMKRPIFNFEKITDFSYNNDGKKFVMSAIQKGQSDIFVFTAASNAYEQITNDIYDDLHPRFVHNSKEIIFSSNRNIDTVKSVVQAPVQLLSHNKDIFIYNYATRSPVLRRVTDTPGLDETQPGDYDSSYYSYLSEENGIRNRFVAYIDSTISFVDTATHYRYMIHSRPLSNYSKNIIETDVNIKAGKYTEVIFDKGKYYMYTGDLAPLASLKSPELKNTYYREYQNNLLPGRDASTRVKPVKELETITTIVINDETSKKDTAAQTIDINNYTFDNDIKSKEKNAKKKETSPQRPETTVAIADSTGEKEFSVDAAKQNNYYINYSIDYVVTQLDNSFLNTSYQKFTGGGVPIYLNPGFTGLFKIGMSDLFEDYRILGGVRLSGDLNSNEYYLSYEDRVKKLDKQLVLHRQSFLNISGYYSLIKVHTHEAKYALKWPFSEVASLRGTLNLRNDKTVFLATDRYNLARNHQYETWGAAKLEYVYDNTMKRGLNLYNGLRMKLFTEFYRQVDKKKTDIFILGFDARYYLKIHRDIIWANRIAASTSLGNQKLIYYLGGVDNWFNAQFDNSINIDVEQNYAYQTLATNMRGFFQNIRNGNSFALLNSEIRFPIFRYFFNRPIRSDFINNFQVIGFGDVGTAWTGPSPYSEKNSLNTTIITSPVYPVTIILNNQKEPIVGGYGFGLRSRIWGYFVRVDWAWGVEDSVILPRLTYLSFCLDF